MRIVVFGGSGLIGGGVVMEALDSPHVTSVLSVGRRSLGITHAKLREIVHSDFEDFTSIADDLADLDACFWCLGTASRGHDEDSYSRITVDFTMAAAKVLRERSPDLCFCFVSGAGTDETERSRMMWARVKGRAENALRDLGFRRLAVFRPGIIRRRRGTKRRSALAGMAQPLFLLIYAPARLLGGATSNVDIGRAMIAVAVGQSDVPTLSSRHINALAAAHGGEAGDVRYQRT